MNFPEPSISPLSAPESKKRALDVASRSSPSAYPASTIKCCEACAPQSVTSWGTTRIETRGANACFRTTLSAGSAANTMKKGRTNLALTHLTLIVFEPRIIFLTAVLLPFAANLLPPSGGSREPTDSDPACPWQWGEIGRASCREGV